VVDGLERAIDEMINEIIDKIIKCMTYFIKKVSQLLFFAIFVLNSHFLYAQSYKLGIPNVFSPNNDGKNDVFLIRAEGIKEIKFLIYNKLGEKVYESSNLSDLTQNGWNGQVDGILQPSDVYVWVIFGKFEDGNDLRSIEGKQTGRIVLLR
jgi:gliding motility-associated-like protein